MSKHTKEEHDFVLDEFALLEKQERKQAYEKNKKYTKKQKKKKGNKRAQNWD